jgi:hypothetical protein
MADAALAASMNTDEEHLVLPDEKENSCCK